MQLVIVAGGKGTRLGLRDIPKPMVPIAGVPLLERQIGLAKRYGITEITILSGHLAEVIRDYFGDGSRWGVRIHHVTEPFPLGTAGSVKLLEREIHDRFLVFYGDVLMDFDIDRLLQFDRETESAGTLVVHPNDHPQDSDLVETDVANRVTRFLSKPHPEGMFYKNLVNAAVYVFSPRVFAYIPSGEFQDFGKNTLPNMLAAGETLRGYRTAEYVKDIGTGNRLLSAEEAVLSGRLERLNRKNSRPCIFLDRDGTLCRNMDTRPHVEDFTLLDDAATAIRAIHQSEYLAVVVTNQPMIAKGFTTFAEVDAVHRKMETLLGREGAFVDGIYFCPHHPEKGFAGEVPELKRDCDCRKPKPGLLLRAAEELGVDLGRSWMIGDSHTDVEAGRAAGCRTIRLAMETDPQADRTAPDVWCAVQGILEDKA